jgi:RNA polymerase sigma-70 factor (ECF subfamily)
MDARRVEQLFKDHAASVVRYCAFSAGSWQDGEDIAAEVFSRLIAHERSLTDEHAVRWLFTVARNECASHHRTQRRRERFNRRLAETPLGEAPAWVDPVVWRYLRSVKETARLVVFLHAVESRPFSEIARLLGKSPSAVKMTHYRALKTLRAAMEADGVTGTAALMGGPSDA